jgi:hypothetical protein
VKIGRARELATEWVRERASADPLFVGAVLHGSANWLADDAELAPTSDLDVMVIRSADDGAAKPGKFRYRDLLLEVSYLQWGEISSAEQLLANYQLVGSFAGGRPLADPSGKLAALIATVSAQYAQPSWVQARVDRACERAVRAFPLRAEDALHDQVTNWLFSTGALCHILLVGALENPTVRKRYLAARGVLERYGFAVEYEPLLDLLGCRWMSPERVEQHLVAMTAAFEAASAIGGGAYFFSADLSDAGRAVAIDGSRELIAQGNHREAIFWIVATFCRCRNVLADVGAHGPFDREFQALLADLGVTTYDDRVKQITRSRAEIPRVRGIAVALEPGNRSVRDD